MGRTGRDDGLAETLRDWIGSLGRAFDRVGRDERGEIVVSTMRLPFEHGRDASGRSLWYETRVFGGRCDGDRCRYATREEAVEGHRAICERVFGPLGSRL